MYYHRYNPLYTAGLLLLAAVLWLLPTDALAQNKQAQSFDDIEAGLTAPTRTPTQAVPLNPSVSKTQALTFYTNRATFEADFPGLPNEDFEGSSFPGGSVGVCPGPLDNGTGGAGCYPGGELIDGFAFSNIGPAGPDRIAILTTGFLGVPSTVAGPNYFADGAAFDFTGPEDVFAAGFEISGPLGGETFNVEIFGPGGSMGSTTAPNGFPSAAFFGVSSDGDPITRIEITGGTGSSAELFDNLTFGLGIQEADLALTKEAEDNGDGTGVYTVTVTNNGPEDATGILVQEYLPGFLTVTGWDATHGVFDVFTGQWDLGDLDNQETAELVIYVRFDAQGEYCNSAAIVASDLDDPNGGNNDDEACTFRPTPRQDPDFVSGQGPGGIINRGGGRFAADMSVTKTAGSASAAAGDVIDWTITVANNGPNSTSGVEVTDTLPACLTVTGAVASQGTVSGTVWSVGAVRVGGSATLVVSTEVGTNCGTEITNVVDITGSNLPDPTDLFNRFDVPPVDNNTAEASVAVTSGAAAKAQLGTNYPNPFNPATVVPFEVRQAGEVTLQVYDLLGRLVETLVSERLTAGAYEAEFRATSLPTGVYLVRLEASGEVHTQRITLMK